MATHQQFLDAIAAAPDDPAPCWMYADWLEEHGNPLCHAWRNGMTRVRLRTDYSRLHEDGGNGDGFGFGDGIGSGSGDGSGNGVASGYGYPLCSGAGFGDGAAFGYGYDIGPSSGDGYGYGKGDGDGFGNEISAGSFR